MTPDQRTFRNHIADGRFQMGADRGDWWVVKSRWPNPLIAVATAKRPGAPAAFVLQFDLTNYPATGPTSQLWDEHRDAPARARVLARGRRPSGNCLQPAMDAITRRPRAVPPDRSDGALRARQLANPGPGKHLGPVAHGHRRLLEGCPRTPSLHGLCGPSSRGIATSGSSRPCGRNSCRSWGGAAVVFASPARSCSPRLGDHGEPCTVSSTSTTSTQRA